MTVQDVTLESENGFLSRLDAAKHWIQSDYDRRGGRGALISFAHEARIQVPMTENATLFADTLKSILPVIHGGASRLEGALSLIQDTYKSTPNLSLIILTDAEFFDPPHFDINLPGATISVIGI